MIVPEIINPAEVAVKDFYEMLNDFACTVGDTNGDQLNKTVTVPTGQYLWIEFGTSAPEFIHDFANVIVYFLTEGFTTSEWGVPYGWNANGTAIKTLYESCILHQNFKEQAPGLQSGAQARKVICYKQNQPSFQSQTGIIL